VDGHESKILWDWLEEFGSNLERKKEEEEKIF
jgi:hypothetical protein